MTRRYLLIFGLILLIAALAGVGMLPQNMFRMDADSVDAFLPDSLIPAPDPPPALLDHSADPVGMVAANPPWVTIMLLFFIMAGAVVGALYAAQRRDESIASKPAHTPRDDTGRVFSPNQTRLIAAGLILIACVLACFLSSVPGMVANSRQPTVPPPELTRSFMQTAIHETVTVDFATQSAPKPQIPPTPTPNAVTADPPEPLDVQVEWPGHMGETDTLPVTVTVYRRSYFGFFPNQSFAHPFNLGYSGRLNVSLAQDGFHVDTDLGQEPSPLRFTSNSWRWTLRPEPGTSGRRVLTLTIEATWTPLDGQGEVVHRVLARPAVAVYVVHPPVPVDTLRLLILASGLLGSILCIPWLYGVFRRHPPA